jgi:hypothetical protein
LKEGPKEELIPESQKECLTEIDSGDSEGIVIEKVFGK